MKIKKPRRVTCGACGKEREFNAYLKKDPNAQYQSRPDEPTDSFYCGCQDDESWSDGMNPGQGFD